MKGIIVIQGASWNDCDGKRKRSLRLPTYTALQLFLHLPSLMSIGGGIAHLYTCNHIYVLLQLVGGI